MAENKKTSNQNNNVKVNVQVGGLSLLLRLFWMFIGNIVLFLIAVGILMGENRPLGLRDGIYWITVLLMIAIRYIDIKYLKGVTASGLSLATMTDWYRHATGLIICSGLIWGIAHTIKHFYV